MPVQQTIVLVPRLNHVLPEGHAFTGIPPGLRGPDLAEPTDNGTRQVGLWRGAAWRGSSSAFLVASSPLQQFDNDAYALRCILNLSHTRRCVGTVTAYSSSVSASKQLVIELGPSSCELLPCSSPLLRARAPLRHPLPSHLLSLSRPFPSPLAMVRLVPTRSSYATPTASTRSSTPSFILRLASNSSSIFKSRNRDRKDITLPDQAASSSTSSSAAATAAATATATSHSTTTTTMALPNILHSPKSSPRTRSRTHTNTGNPPPSTTSPTLRINTLNGAGDNSLSPPVPTFGRSKSLGTGITLAQMGGSAGAAGVGGSGSSTSTSFNALSDAPPLGGGSSSSTAGTTSSSTGSGRRGRSSSILSIHEIKENYDDDLDKSALANLNADWVNYKGERGVHPPLVSSTLHRASTCILSKELITDFPSFPLSGRLPAVAYDGFPPRKLHSRCMADPHRPDSDRQSARRQHPRHRTRHELDDRVAGLPGGE